MKLKEILNGLTSKKGLPKVPETKSENALDYKPFPANEVSWNDKENLLKHSGNQIYCKQMINKYIKDLNKWKIDIELEKQNFKDNLEKAKKSEETIKQKYINDTIKSIEFWKRMLKKADAEADSSKESWNRRGAFQI